MLGGMLRYWTVSGTTTICVFVSAGTASFTAPPQFVDCHSFRRSYMLPKVIALDLRRRANSLPSACLGGLLPSVRSTLYPSGARASARLDLVGPWPDLRLILLVPDYLHIVGI